MSRESGENFPCRQDVERSLRERIAAALATAQEENWGIGDLDLADAVIRELEAERDELVKEAVRELQDKYILVPKSQTLAETAPPRLVINRDCTPLQFPEEWETTE